ncbi:MAG: hypothetical protein K6T73_07725 [Candidatus Bathyarchaeota archaeon]|nr:hypothetical protein [Candidatus Bathyarchaeota archaeon]
MKKQEQPIKQTIKQKNKPPEKRLKLLPTLREKRHYIVIAVEAKDKEFEETVLKEIINKAILNFIGILGYAQAGPIFVESGIVGKKFYFIVSVTTKYVDKVKAAIALIDEPNLSFRSVGVSGTIKKSRRFL